MICKPLCLVSICTGGGTHQKYEQNAYRYLFSKHNETRKSSVCHTKRNCNEKEDTLEIRREIGYKLYFYYIPTK